MRRKNNRVIAGIVGLAVAGGLGVLGLVMTSNANFAKTYTADQLSRQNITFNTVDTLSEKERQSPCLVRYAGQRLTTGSRPSAMRTTSSASTSRSWPAAKPTPSSEVPSAP